MVSQSISLLRLVCAHSLLLSVAALDAGGLPASGIPVSGLHDAARLAKTWEEGKETYRFACARCHGEDGNDESYMYIRKLGGIGKRLSREAIKARIHPLPRGNSVFSVRGHLLTLERLDALVAYVAGL